MDDTPPSPQVMINNAILCNRKIEWITTGNGEHNKPTNSLGDRRTLKSPHPCCNASEWDFDIEVVQLYGVYPSKEWLAHDNPTGRKRGPEQGRVNNNALWKRCFWPCWRPPSPQCQWPWTSLWSILSPLRTRAKGWQICVLFLLLHWFSLWFPCPQSLDVLSEFYWLKTHAGCMLLDGHKDADLGTEVREAIKKK